MIQLLMQLCFYSSNLLFPTKNLLMDKKFLTLQELKEKTFSIFVLVDRNICQWNHDLKTFMNIRYLIMDSDKVINYLVILEFIFFVLTYIKIDVKLHEIHLEWMLKQIKYHLIFGSSVGQPFVLFFSGNT